jgi:hypothetical protein
MRSYITTRRRVVSSERKLVWIVLGRLWRFAKSMIWVSPEMEIHI